MAPGSHAVWGGWETRKCIYCGERVTLKQSSGHSFGPPSRSWHTACAPRVVGVVWERKA